MQVNSTGIAVIAPFYNSAKHVIEWLDGLEKQELKDFKVYLVNDCSTDNTKEEIKRAISYSPLNIAVLDLDKNVGPSAARNSALKMAIAEGAKILVLLDSDCRVSPDWISRHVQFHNTRQDVSILGGGIQGVAHTKIGKADGFCSWFSAVPDSKNGFVKKLHLSTTNMSIKVATFAQTGFFDETLATGEDVAFCRKAQKAGLLLWLDSTIVIQHLDRNDYQSAKRHHYRWGLHSFTISTIENGGGYYEVLKKVPFPSFVALLVPVIAALNVIFILGSYTRYHPKVWLYFPWIIALKWENALGVYRGYRVPELCLLSKIEVPQ